MADERDFELLDDYLTNRMGELDRTAFEQKIKAEPDLQQEYALQKRMIQGIKEARISELKSMLNNVPVPSSGAGNTLAIKIMIAAVATLIIAAVSYWSLKEDHRQLPEQKIQSEQPVPADETATPEMQPETKTQRQAPAREQERVESDKNQTSAGTEHSKPSLAKKPDPLSAPAAKNPVAKDEVPPDDGDSSNGNPTPDNHNLLLTPVPPSLAVETDRNNRRYTFHYQFRDGKLLLFGPFENAQYEILEFIRDEKQVAFLFYKDQYYPLESGDEEVRPLAPLNNPALIQKLKEYRTSK